MGNILVKIKEKFFFAFLYGLILKATVWVIFWGKLKKKFFSFLYGLLTIWL
jgi:hypothetical protein